MCGSFLEQVLCVGCGQARRLVGNLAQAFSIGLACLILCAVSVAPAYSMTVKEMRDKVPASRLAKAKAKFMQIEQRLGSVSEAQQQLGAVRQLIETADQSYIRAKEQLGMIVKAMPVKNDSKVIQPEEEELANRADLDTQVVEAALTKLRNLKPEQAVAVVTDQPTGKGLSSLNIQQMKEKQATTHNDADNAYNASSEAAHDKTKPISKVDETLVNKASAAAVDLKTSLGQLTEFKSAESTKPSGENATNSLLGWFATDWYAVLTIICSVLIILVVLWMHFGQSILLNWRRHLSRRASSSGSRPYSSSGSSGPGHHSAQSGEVEEYGESSSHGSKGGDESPHSKPHPTGLNDDQGHI